MFTAPDTFRSARPKFASSSQKLRRSKFLRLLVVLAAGLTVLQLFSAWPTPPRITQVQDGDDTNLSISSSQGDEKLVDSETYDEHLIPPKHENLSTSAADIPVVVIAYKRAAYLQRTLDSIEKYRPSQGFPLIISQDESHQAVTDVIEAFVAQHDNVQHVRFVYDPSIVKQHRHFKPDGPLKKYYKLAQHFEITWRRLFDEQGHENAIVLEDDMEIAPDFFSYFLALAPVLNHDTSTLCISAWNDNGQPKFASDARALWRTDVFPGLGWMMSSALWREIGWRGFWDEFLREDPQRKGRSCIFPEVNRVYTFGEAGGASGGQHFAKFLKPIRLNTEHVDWSHEDLSVIGDGQAFQAHLTHVIRNARVIQFDDIATLPSGVSDFVVEFGDLAEFSVFARRLGLIDDHKEKHARASFHDVVAIRHRGNRVFFRGQNSDLR